MRKICTTLLVLVGVLASFQRVMKADEVTISLYANILKTATGAPMPTNGLVILVASTNDAIFNPPTNCTSFTSGDDIELGRWNLSSPGNPGELLAAVYNKVFFGGWGSGDPLGIYWYPTLNISSVGPTNGTPYGFYRDSNTSTPADESAPWVTPAAGSYVELKFLTADAGGTVNAAIAGNAANTAVVDCEPPTFGPASLANGKVNSSYNQTITASGGGAPYTFALTGGALPAGLNLNTNNGTISGTPSAFGVYGFVVTAISAGSPVGSTNFTVRILPLNSDLTAPTVKINQINGVVLTNAALTLTGTAKDTGGIYRVHYWLDPSVLDSTLTNQMNTASQATLSVGAGVTNWTAVIPAASQGLHTFAVVSEDITGNLTKKPVYITLHYGTNDVAPLVGIYDGLFSADGGTNNFKHQDSGYFQAKVKYVVGKIPTFSVKLKVDGDTLSGAGTIEMTGVGTLTKVIDRQTKYGKPNLNVVLNFPFGALGTVTGMVGPTNTAWSSMMVGYAEVPGETNYDGTYTLVIPGSATNSALEPGGDGFGLVIVSNGTLKVAGSKLGDNSTLAQKVVLNAPGKWPFYSAASPDYGTPANKRSAIMGWLEWNGSEWEGALAWEKRAGSKDTLYTGGFATLTTVAMSPYFGADPLSTPIYGVGNTNLTVSFYGVGLVPGLTNTLTLDTSKGKNLFVFDKYSNPNKMKVGLTPKTGKLAPGFVDGGLAPWGGYGVALTNNLSGHGYMYNKVSGTNTERFHLEVNP